jgi:hypothetical protein
MKRLIAMCVVLSACDASMDSKWTVDSGPSGITDVHLSSGDTGFVISPLTGLPDAGTTWSVAGSTVNMLGGWNVPLSLPVGTMVPAISGTVRDNTGSDGNAVAMMLVSYVGSAWTVLAQATSDSSGSAQSLNLTPSHVVTATEVLQIRFTSLASPPPTRMSTIGMVQVGRPSIQTLLIPVAPAASGPRRTSMYALVTGLDADPLTGPQNLYAPIAVPVSTVIRGLRARVQDGGSGTKLEADILSTSDNSQTFALVATSPKSTGAGIEETIALPGLSITTAPATQYYIKVYNAAGIFASFVYRLEIDIN